MCVCVRARVCMLWKVSYVELYDIRLCTDVMCPVQRFEPHTCSIDIESHKKCIYSCYRYYHPHRFNNLSTKRGWTSGS